ncbi:MAG: TonB-dependent receptor [Cyclobacteriaceae bacterium]|nr:TonB-dependent receptor [Cyclobacteriaceae bacterium]
MALSVYNSHDKFTYDEEFGFAWDVFTISFKYDQILSPDLFSGLSISYSDISNSSFQPSGVDGFVLGNGMNNYKIKEDLHISRFPSQHINIGFEGNAYFPDSETLVPFDHTATTIPYEGQKDRGVEAAVYLNDAVELTSRLTASIGLRYNYYMQVGPAQVNEYTDGLPTSAAEILSVTAYKSGEKVIAYQGFDPRVALTFMLDISSSIKMSYNKIHQYIHLVSNTTSAMPIDFWQVSNTYFQPLSSDNFSVGYYKNFRMNAFETSVEAYYRNMDNIIEYKDFPDLFLNNHLETELVGGKGRGYGLELFVKKKSGKFNGWLSYTFSRTFVKVDHYSRQIEINQGQWFPSKFDQPHNFSLVGNLNFNKTNQFSFNFTYATGRPLTAPDANYALNGTIVPNFSNRNEYRMPDYIRLDVSYTIQRGLLRTARYKDSFTFSVYNLLARRNAYSIYFKRERGTNYGAYKLAILGTLLPSITYNFNF